MPQDLRLQIGTIGHSRVVPRILCAAEAHRIYGSKADSTIVQGQVEEVRLKLLNGRTYKYLYCVWSIQGRKKRVEVPLGNVKLGPDFSRPDGIPDRELEMSYPINEAESGDCEQVEQNTVLSPNNGGQQEDSHVTRESTVPDETGNRTNTRDSIVPPVSRKNRLSGDNFVPVQYDAEAHGQLWKVREVVFPLNVSVTRSLVVTFSNRLYLRPTTEGELFKFFGILVLMTRFKFSSRKELWHENSVHKYIPAANFGRIMSYNRFDDIRRFLCFTSRSREEPKSCSSFDRWALCEDFLLAINDHRQERMVPSELLCVDESLSRWYGRGGEWISLGLPHYVSMDRKPEAGCEIQDIACGRSGIMLGLRFVKSAGEEKLSSTLAGKNHGTRVLMELCAPWSGSERIVCADSYFASVEAASILFDNGLRFTGVIKNSTKKFPMQYLNNFEMAGRGDHIALVTTCKSSRNLEITIAAVGWVDRSRRYFVSTVGSTLPGNAQQRMRMREMPNGLGTRRVFVEVSIPSLAETYYSAASKVDRHNRCCQDDLDIEKVVKEREWSFRVNNTFLSICIVDAWLLYSLGKTGRQNMKPHDFYAVRAEELIDNSFDTVGLRSKNNHPAVTNHSPARQQPTSGVYEHLTPTKKRRKTSIKNNFFWFTASLWCVWSEKYLCVFKL